MHVAKFTDTHTPQHPFTNTEMCYLTDYSEAPIPPGSSDSPGGLLEGLLEDYWSVRSRTPQSTTWTLEDIPPGSSIFLHTGI